MKIFLFVSLLIIAGCSTQPKPLVQPFVVPLVEPNLRHAELIRTYHVGRHVDSSDVLHEQHPVYRVESRARWNFKPATPFQRDLLNPPPDTAYLPPPTNDVILAELSRQKEATQRVMHQASQLARSYDEIQKLINEITAVARNHALMNVRVADNERRLIELQQELSRLGSQALSQTNGVDRFSSPDVN